MHTTSSNFEEKNKYKICCLLPSSERVQIGADRLAEVVVVVAGRWILPHVVNVHADHFDGRIAERERLSAKQHVGGRISLINITIGGYITAFSGYIFYITLSFTKRYVFFVFSGVFYTAAD